MLTQEPKRRLWLFRVTAATLALLSLDSEAHAESRGLEPSESCQAPARFDLTTPHPLLQAELRSALHRAGLDPHVRRRRLGISVVDVTQSDWPYYAGVNDDVMMYAASLPKIAILLAVMRAVQAGSVSWSYGLHNRLTAMVTASSNPAAAWATDLVGLSAIARSVRDPGLCFYDMVHGGLWMGRAYRANAVARRDPLRNLSHTATARQTARFYLMLHDRVLVSPHMSERMMAVMAPPRHHHKFVGGIGNRPGVTFLARKSGTWGHAHSDSAVIQHYGKRYILVGVGELGGGEWVMRQVARLVDDIIIEGAHRKANQ